ncbi:MAG TPA: hydroxymethylglutaryl-CoA lyase [Anaeromyxobacteraceae bacterium]|nr:hydroxymethylglutaryl-CoA lyase [Anaeromyxobacteraceae bacterium]
MAPRVTVYEVGPRDGLQNEARSVPVEDKLRFLRLLAAAGFSRIEATSFVSPKRIPQLADSDELVASLPGRPGPTYLALVANERGLDRLFASLDRAGAHAAHVDAAVFVSASETHNHKNVHHTIGETLAIFAVLASRARARGLRMRGYVSMAWACPYEGAIAPERVVELVDRLLGVGCYQVSLGDTVGVATPNHTRRLLEQILSRAKPEEIALHMHDTRGTALANVLVGLEAGLSTFDAAVGGLGGCPYAKGASGNLATEDLVYMLHGMGYQTGIDWPLLIAAGELAQKLVGRQLPGKALQAELSSRLFLAADPSDSVAPA